MSAGRSCGFSESKERGCEAMRISWVDGFEISVNAENNTVVVSANREGLLSLAGQLAALAEEKPGTHIHYDAGNSLEEGSAEMIIEKAHSSSAK